jgi:plasmid maintenance system antidote protein VapI
LRRARQPGRPAVPLAQFFGNDAEFWLQRQLAWDFYAARKELRAASTSA